MTKKEVKTAQKRSHNPKEYLRRAMRSAVRFATEGGRVGLSGDSSGQRNSRFYSCSPEIVLETKRGIKMVASGSDLSVTPELAFNGVYEPAEESFVAKMLKGGDTFIDVGANVGVFTLLAAQKVFRFGRVVAFEPNPCVTRLLRKSLVLNWWQGRVDIQECAVADFKGVKTLYFSGDNLGGARLDTDEVSPVVDEVDRLLSVTQKLDANVVRLDDVFPVDLPLRILKIDVEGHEATVLRGASRLLSRKCVDFIILEMIADIASKKQWQDTASEIQKLISLGYSLHKLSSEGDLMPLENYELDLENNRTRSVVLSAGLIQT